MGGGSDRTASVPRYVLLVSNARGAATAPLRARVRELLGSDIKIVRVGANEIAAARSRRSHLASGPSVTTRGQRDRRFLVKAAGARFFLTATQLKVFMFLAQRQGQWVSAAELVQHALRTHHSDDSAIVRVHVHSLRRSLGAWARVVQTSPVRGRGYRLTSGYTFDFPAPPADVRDIGSRALQR